VVLYGNENSSSTWRVRASLVYKGLDYVEKTIDMHDKDKHSEYKRKVNSMGFVPAIQLPKYSGDRVYW
jgi:glutathione S-transferase